MFYLLIITLSKPFEYMTVTEGGFICVTNSLAELSTHDFNLYLRGSWNQVMTVDCMR